jgi:hypothetical protein
MVISSMVYVRTGGGFGGSGFFGRMRGMVAIGLRS